MAASLDLVDVKHYDAVIEATKLVCGHKGTKVDKPSLLLMLGRCLIKGNRSHQENHGYKTKRFAG